MDCELAYSRVCKTADQLGGLAEDRHRFLNKTLLLTGERDVLLSANGEECLLDSIRLAIRICPNVVLSLPPEIPGLAERAMALAHRLAFGNAVEFQPQITSYTCFDAILSVGMKAEPDLPWTTINSNGFVARITSGARDISDDCRITNPIGALAAASLGVGELFKRLLKIKADRCQLLDGFSFSLRDYSVNTCHYGPEIPAQLTKDLVIVGAGAIGNGLVHLISRLPFRGEITIVDRQTYGRENLGTCLLLSPHDIDQLKANVLARILRSSGINAVPIPQSFEVYAKKIRQSPEIVLNALDNIDTRHEVQRSLWPNIVIDGAIGDFTCQVSRHPWIGDIACLICLFQNPTGHFAEKLQSEATGLPKDRLQHPDSILTLSDVSTAASDKQDFLLSRVGRPLCSVVQDGIAQMLSTEKQRGDFRPSVPFVACFSACMVLSETLAYLSGWESRLEPRFQFDFLLGPAHGQEIPQARRASCLCSRRRNINIWRVSHGLPAHLA